MSGSHRRGTPPPPAAYELVAEHAALVLARQGDRKEATIVRSLRFVHAFGPLAALADGACDAHSRELLAALEDLGLVARDDEAVFAVTAEGSARLAETSAALDSSASGIPGHVRRGLAGRVDAAQARMFADRCEALLRLVERLVADGHTAVEAEILRAVFGLRVHARLESEPEGRTRDVRSMIDFFYTQAAVLKHRYAGRNCPKRLRREDVRWRTVRRGVAAARVEVRLRRGPLLAHLLRVDPRKARLQAVDVSRLTDEERQLLPLASRRGALEATSGGFFLYSEEDIEPPALRGDPIGLLVADGEVRSPPLFARAALLVDEAGHVHVRRVPLKGTVVRWGCGQVVLRNVNRRPRGAGEVIGYTRAFGVATPGGCGRTVTVVHRRVVDRAGDTAAIPLLGLVIAFPTDAVADDLYDSLAPGTEVSYELATRPGMARIRDAMAGGPMLVEDGRPVVDLAREEFLPGVPPVTLSGDATIGMNLLPRLAWGVTADHQLIAAAVDGRNVTRSVGETLMGMGRLMRDVGCVAALNFDGGSSKRMCIDGEVVDLSTTSLVDGECRPAPPRKLSSAWIVRPRRRPAAAAGGRKGEGT